MNVQIFLPYFIYDNQLYLPDFATSKIFLIKNLNVYSPKIPEQGKHIKVFFFLANTNAYLN